jgi:hypothetical protein
MKLLGIIRVDSNIKHQMQITPYSIRRILDRKWLWWRVRQFYVDIEKERSSVQNSNWFQCNYGIS